MRTAQYSLEMVHALFQVLITNTYGSHCSDIQFGEILDRPEHIQESPQAQQVQQKVHDTPGEHSLINFAQVEKSIKRNAKMYGKAAVHGLLRGAHEARLKLLEQRRAQKKADSEENAKERELAEEKRVQKKKQLVMKLVRARLFDADMVESDEDEQEETQKSVELTEADAGNLGFDCLEDDDKLQGWLGEKKDIIDEDWEDVNFKNATGWKKIESLDSEDESALPALYESMEKPIDTIEITEEGRQLKLREASTK
jgi:hypothetical protein